MAFNNNEVKKHFSRLSYLKFCKNNFPFFLVGFGCNTDIKKNFQTDSDTNDLNSKIDCDEYSESSNKEEESPVIKYKLYRKIFVGNLGYRVRRDELMEFFSKFGHVYKVHIVKDHLTDRSRGIAFVSFETEEEADRALQASDEDLILHGRKLRVHQAEESKRTSFKKYQPLPDLFSGTNTNGEDVHANASFQLEEKEDATQTNISEELLDRLHINLDDLCDELLICIFSFLPVKDKGRIERVCHRWRILALQSWMRVESLDFQNMFKRFGGLTDKMLNSILQRCGPSLKSLDVSASPRFLTDYAMDIIGKYCLKLTKLNLSGVSATNKSLQSLSGKCPHLKWIGRSKGKVEIQEYIAVPPPRLSDTGISKLAEKCPTLEELYIDSCFHLTDSSIHAVGNEFPSLRILHAGNTFPQVTMESWSQLQHASRLVELNLSQNLDITDQSLVAMAVGCKSLRFLDISSCHRHLTDVGIQALCHCACLRFLVISYLHQVHDESIELLALNGDLQKLTARACGGITDKALQALAENSILLEFLDVSGCMQITNVSLQSFVEHPREADQQLVLNFGGTSVAPEKIELPPFLKLCMLDFSVYNLRPDRELLLPEPYSDEESEEEFEERPEINKPYMPAGSELEDSWLEEEDYGGQINDFSDAYLQGDDPLAEENWDLS